MLERSKIPVLSGGDGDTPSRFPRPSECGVASNPSYNFFFFFFWSINVHFTRDSVRPVD